MPDYFRIARNSGANPAVGAFIQRSKVEACGGTRSFGVDLATAFFHAVADLPLVNIQVKILSIIYLASFERGPGYLKEVT
jgi:hypothetical protein